MDPVSVGLITGLAGIGGSLWQNDRNVALSRENRRWQERMSNTEIQRRMADARAAGVNPIYALGTSGAGSGAGSLAHVENPMDSGISSAIDAQRVSAELAAMAQTTRKTRAEADLVEAQAKNAKKLATVGLDMKNLEFDEKYATLENLRRSFPELLRKLRMDALLAELMEPEARMKAKYPSAFGRTFGGGMEDVFSSIGNLARFLKSVDSRIGLSPSDKWEK